MAKCDDLLEKAKRNPKGLRFAEVLDLAECWGFRHRNPAAATSHRIYKRDGFMQLLNFQPDRNGMAKRQQVKQLLAVIELLSEPGSG